MYEIDDLVPVLAAIVEEQGQDHWVASCQYFYDNGEPSCIIGHLLQRLHLELPITHNTFPWISSTGRQPSASNVFPGVFSDEANKFLQTLQAYQDDKKAWGYALKETVNEFSVA